MSLRVVNIDVDCADPQRVADFWSAALDGQLETRIPDAFVTMKLSDGAGWFFMRVPDGT